MPEFVPEHVPSEGDEFFQGYMKAAEWLLDTDSTPEEGGIDRDAIKGWSPAALAEALEDCQAFQESNAADLARYAECYRPRGEYAPIECAGHDFWLSRNGHGVGYFDRGNDPVFGRLQDAAGVWSGRDAYLGDDGFLYFA